ncbi:MAG: DNA adenine methylase [Candidatus Kryptonium sp.]
MKITLFPYIGGKSMHFDWIIQFFPQHKAYVEVFGGSAAILLNKPRSEIEVYNDIDDNLVKLFRVLRDKEKSQELYRKLKYTLYARSELELAGEILKNKEKHDDITIAWAVYVAARMSFGSRIYSPTFSYSSEKVGKSKTYFDSLRNLILIKKRLENVIIENLDWEDCMNRYDNENTLFYLDPPYPIEILNSDKVYTIDNGFRTLEQHRVFLEKLKKYKGMIILSGYENDVYNEVLSDWHIERRKTYSPTATFHYKHKENHSPTRVEVIWINPQCLARLNQLKLFQIL